MNAIEIKNLSKSYGNKIAVDNLNLSIGQGELFGLLGVNGAGKTTTIKMLSCLAVPTSGDALLLGNSILKDSHQVKENIGVSPQETAVAPNLTVRENLELIAGVYGHGSRDAREKASAIIETFSLEQVEKQKAKTLSGGWQRRLSIAMALISQPKVLFLDEPTLGLDVLARRELWNVIRSLKGKITIILTTHYLEEAEALCDRLCVMADGKLKAIGTVDELKKQSGKENFEDAFIELASIGGAL
jgi:ABC-2 type transport system ATP-binding protein